MFISNNWDIGTINAAKKKKSAVLKQLEAIMIAIWTNHLSLANRAIDSAHKDILEMINRVDDLIGTKDAAALKETFKSLEDSLCACFEVEEKITQAINVDFAQHRLAHQQLWNDFHHMRNILAEKNGKWSGGEAESLAALWAKRFVQHIKNEGKQMKVVLSTQYYDFQPD